jgi:hypothetical protein
MFRNKRARLIGSAVVVTCGLVALLAFAAVVLNIHLSRVHSVAQGGAIASSPSSTTQSPSPAPIASSSPASCSQIAKPDPRISAAMAWDPVDQEFVLFGGLSATVGSLGDTWVFKGSCWTKVPVTGGPTPRDNAVLAFDPVAGAVVLFGGVTHRPGASNLFLADTWLWTAASGWMPQTLLIKPTVALPVGTYDSARKRLVVFGTSTSGAGETWLWDGKAWSQAHPSTLPPSRTDSAFGFDPTTNAAVLFGGFSQGHGLLNDTWSWDGADWIQLQPKTSPSPRSLASSASADSFTIFGGSSGSQVLFDTWIWHLGNWEQIVTPHSPVARRAAAGATSPDGIFIFGGQSVSGTLDDAWNWRGVDWQAVA